MSQTILCITFDPWRRTLKNPKLASSHAPSTDKHNLLGNINMPDATFPMRELCADRELCSRRAPFSRVNVIWCHLINLELLWDLNTIITQAVLKRFILWYEQKRKVIYFRVITVKHHPVCCYLFILQYQHPQRSGSLLMPLTDRPFLKRIIWLQAHFYHDSTILLILANTYFQLPSLHKHDIVFIVNYLQ